MPSRLLFALCCLTLAGVVRHLAALPPPPRKDQPR
jgi:hypothetical protein